MVDHNYQWPPKVLADEKQHRYKLAEAVLLLKDGKNDAHGSITLTANAASTTLADVRIGGNTVLVLSPTTANAAAAVATTYYDTLARGSLVIHHANNAQTDKTFGYALVG